MEKDQIAFLKQFITDKRFELFKKVLENRTRYITVVLEDIFQSHNASAVLRTADCFGVQDIHIIENRNKYTINPDVALGSAKWVNLIKYNKNENNTLIAIHYLRENGYRIVATSPRKNGILLDEIDIQKGKIALFFGTEMDGLSEVMLNNADEYLQIPMYGFTESFNISVSAAIVLYNLTSKLRKSGLLWQLSENEKDAEMLEWLKKSVRHSSKLIKEFLLKKNNF